RGFRGWSVAIGAGGVVHRQRDAPFQIGAAALGGVHVKCAAQLVGPVCEIIEPAAARRLRQAHAVVPDEEYQVGASLDGDIGAARVRVFGDVGEGFTQRGKQLLGDGTGYASIQL